MKANALFIIAVVSLVVGIAVVCKAIKMIDDSGLNNSSAFLICASFLVLVVGALSIGRAKILQDQFCNIFGFYPRFRPSPEDKIRVRAVITTYCSVTETEKVKKVAKAFGF